MIRLRLAALGRCGTFMLVVELRYSVVQIRPLVRMKTYLRLRRRSPARLLDDHHRPIQLVFDSSLPPMCVWNYTCRPLRRRSARRLNPIST